MESVQEIYNETVSHLTSDEQLQLSSLILTKLSEKKSHSTPITERRHLIDLLNEWEGQRLFKTSAEADAYLREERNSWDR